MESVKYEGNMYEYLDKIEKPEDIKKIPIKELGVLAAEIRDFLLLNISKTGGHLASNLGVVELTIALLCVFSPPKDKIVWDVGHQSYVYKILTGRKEEFSRLRQYGGISGFPKRSESKYDCFDTGHSSTSVSAALGISCANELLHKDGTAIAVIGDGALSGGLAFEGLSNAAAHKKNFIVILNDNNMSISRGGIGGFSEHLTRLRSTPGYVRFKSYVERKVSKLPFGETIKIHLKKLKKRMKYFLLPRSIFEEFGFTYWGPFDGHDISLIMLMLNRAKKMDNPVLIHLITQKGRGYEPAELNPTEYHGVETFDLSEGISTKYKKDIYTLVFGQTLCELAQKNNKICAVTAAMASGTGTEEFARRFPERFFDVGIAEGHAVTFSAGLATNGMLPFAAIYSSFLQRAYDQILHDVCLQNLSVVFCIDRCGIVGKDGETHQGIYDLAYMTSMPNMTILSPASFDELREMLCYAQSGVHQGPLAIRYPRGDLQAYDKFEAVPKFEIGKPYIVSPAEKVCIICVGAMTKIGVDTAKVLSKDNIRCGIMNLRTVYPLPKDDITEFTADAKIVVIIEDGILENGIGSKIVKLLHRKQCEIIQKGFPKIVPHGDIQTLMHLCGLESKQISVEIKNCYKSIQQNEIY